MYRANFKRKDYWGDDMDMGLFFWGILCGSGLTMILAFAVNKSAYRLGVNDGFMFSKEPNNPGYQEARKILISYGKYNEPDQGIDNSELKALLIKAEGKFHGKD